MHPKLKITLKLPANNASSNSAGTATPDDAEMDYAAFKRTPKRRAKGTLIYIPMDPCFKNAVARVIQDVDIESEDPTSPSDSEDDGSMQDAPSRSTGTPTTGPKPMTTRQAVLASVVDPTHVSLSESFSHEPRTFSYPVQMMVRVARNSLSTKPSWLFVARRRPERGRI